MLRVTTIYLWGSRMSSRREPRVVVRAEKPSEARTPLDPTSERNRGIAPIGWRS